MTERRCAQLGRWLLAALTSRRISRAQVLLKQGADPNSANSAGETALYTALVHGCYPLVELLLERGADPNVPGPYETYPLHLAAAWGREHAPELLEQLLRYGARIDVRDDEGATPMFLAAKSAKEAAIRTLQRHGANISEANAEQDTALTFACCWGYIDQAAMLLRLGIDVQARDNLGMTALSWAARNGHADTIRLLLAHGVEVNIADQWGMTPLMLASHFGSLRSVRLLLDAGADPRSLDTEGRSAVEHARFYAGRDLTEALQEQITDGGRIDPAAERIIVERRLSAEGEQVVSVGVVQIDDPHSGRYIERSDGHDAIVALLRAMS